MRCPVRQIDDATGRSWGWFITARRDAGEHGAPWEYLERNGRMVDARLTPADGADACARKTLPVNPLTGIVRPCEQAND